MQGYGTYKIEGKEITTLN